MGNANDHMAQFRVFQGPRIVQNGQVRTLPSSLHECLADSLKGIPVWERRCVLSEQRTAK